MELKKPRGIIENMNKNTKYILGILIVLILLIGGLFLLQKGFGASEEDNKFAMCLAEKGAKFYGAFWCPHCREQKQMLKNSKNIPYVECSTPDTKGQLQVCKDIGIESYPTWIFADGEVAKGKVSVENLSQKTGCELPVKN